MDLKGTYNYLLVELSDSRTREWPLLSSPYPVTLITLVYLYFVCIAGPRYMKDKPSYKLRGFILFYNFIQILANIWLIKEHISAGWFTEYGLRCAKREMYNSKKALKMFKIMWWVLLLKIFDYVETCVFVLRKKQNQVSLLHVYHHISNTTFTWYYLKYVLDERATFITLVNCSVHVIMYVYYFLAAYSPILQQMISPIKSIVTRMQMIQFVGMIIYLLQAMNPECEATYGVLPIFILNLLIFLYLFYDFYKKSYTKILKEKNY